jgi:hypothetical protein
VNLPNVPNVLYCPGMSEALDHVTTIQKRIADAQRDLAAASAVLARFPDAQPVRDISRGEDDYTRWTSDAVHEVVTHVDPGNIDVRRGWDLTEVLYLPLHIDGAGVVRVYSSRRVDLDAGFAAMNAGHQALVEALKETTRSAEARAARRAAGL